MNLRGYILGTVAANLALVGALLWQTAQLPAPGARGGVTVTTNVVTEVVSEASPRPAVVSVPGSPPFRWEQLESTNHLQVLTNLLAIGCPPETARDILEARVADDFRARLRELTRPLQARFWDTAATDGKFEALFEDTDTEEAIDQLKDERKRVEKQLTSISKSETNTAQNPISPEFRHLPADKAAAMMELSAQFVKAREATNRALAKAPPAELAAKRKELFERHQAERRALLNEAEWNEMDLRRASEQNVTVRELRGFTATSEELRSVAQVWREFLTAHPGPTALDLENGVVGPAYNRKLVEREEQRKAFLTARLGEAGFAAFERGSDPRFHTLLKLARRLEQPTETAANWLALQTAAQEQAGQIRANAGLADEPRAVALLAIRAETERTLQAAVGARGWGAYLRHAGDWLKQLTQ